MNEEEGPVTIYPVTFKRNKQGATAPSSPVWISNFRKNLRVPILDDEPDDDDEPGEHPVSLLLLDLSLLAKASSSGESTSASVYNLTYHGPRLSFRTTLTSDPHRRAVLASDNGACVSLTSDGKISFKLYRTQVGPTQISAKPNNGGGGLSVTVTEYTLSGRIKRVDLDAVDDLYLRELRSIELARATTSSEHDYIYQCDMAVLKATGLLVNRAFEGIVEGIPGIGSIRPKPTENAVMKWADED